MREILFRGKRVDNGEWVFGDLLHNCDCVKIRENETEINHVARSFPVLPKTIGQYTGLTDRNGLTRIFEGDIVRIFDGEYCSAVIEYSNEKGSFTVDDTSLYYWVSDIEVVGNIHDNGYPF